MKEEHPQVASFLHDEADQYFRRNQLSHDEAFSDYWNIEISRYLAAGNSILEIGCSDARRLAAIERHAVPGCSYSGVDPSKLAIEGGLRLYPHFDLRVGTADNTGFSSLFDMVIFGFCLYLCDRNLVLRAAAHADQLLSPGGILIVIDFDPISATKRPYSHKNGLWSYKMDYPSIFLALPNYSLEFKATRNSRPHSRQGAEIDRGDRIALSILRKSLEDGFLVEN